MFGKWFKRGPVPSNTGKTANENIERLHYVKVFGLELSNMEDTPVYTLTHQLTVGSEIGNIVIADPSVSPRHASFILQQEVASVIDHGSVSGTYVNGTKIPPGKYIILEETDVVNVGDLEIRLKISTEAQTEEEIPEIPVEDEAVEEVPEAPVDEDEVEDVPEAKVPKFNPREHLQKNKTKKKKKAFSSTYATNSLVRTVAVLCDFLIAYSLLVIFNPFDDFREFLNFIPNLLTSVIDVDWTAMWEAIVADYGFLGEISQGAIQFFSSTFQAGPLILVFILVRLVSTLVFGVSISELVLGVKAGGNGIWARIGGVLRVLIGVVTGPFLIFDAPAIISRRTFKEFLTFTHTYLNSKFVAVLGTILYLPLLVGFALISPLLQGLEPPEPIMVNDRVDQRVKVKVSEEAAPQAENNVRDISQFFEVELNYNPDQVAILPSFKFQGSRSKINLRPGVLFYQKDLLRPVVLEVYKNFDMQELLNIGMKGNVFLHEKYPELYNVAYTTETNPAFKAKSDARAQMAFANEFIAFTKMAFSLSAENAIEIMETETLLLGGLVEFKNSFLALIEYKDFDSIGFIKIGNVIFMKISYLKQKPFDLIIPLIKGEGRILKVNFDRRENLNEVASKFYKYNLEKSNWLPDHNLQANQEVMTTMEVVDLFAMDVKDKILSMDKAQSLYAYYFETSIAVMKRRDQSELEIWKETIRTTMKLIELLPTRPVQEGEEDPRLKLEQNFRDMNDALQNQNLEFFGISEGATV